MLNAFVSLKNALIIYNDLCQNFTEDTYGKWDALALAPFFSLLDQITLG